MHNLGNKTIEYTTTDGNTKWESRRFRIATFISDVSGAVAVPLLIGTGLNFDSQQMTYLISIDIFMCGVATLLQLTVNKFLGLACQSF